MSDLFAETPTDPHAEWVGMPEFVQEADRPHQALTVRFRCAEDVQAFATALGIKVTPLTKSLWYPPLVRGDLATMEAYVAEP